jgi:hypothetical protein
LTPAKDHKFGSSLIHVTAIAKVENWFRKTRACLCFKTSQETSIARDAMTFLKCPLFWTKLVNHSLMDRSASHSLGFTSCKPSHSLTLDQTLIVNVKRQVQRRWATNSWSSLQSFHLPQFCHLVFQIYPSSKLYFKAPTMWNFCISE